MNRGRVVDGLCWGASVVILVALFVSLDGYVRPSLEGGWGHERRAYFNDTLRRAHELQDEGRYRIEPSEPWLLRGGWDEELSGGKAIAGERRARLVLPVLRVEPLQIELDVMPLPPPGQEAMATELEYGLNGVELGRFVVSPEGGVLRFRGEPPVLYRGDNILYLYRLTRRSDPFPWLALVSMNVREWTEGVIGFAPGWISVRVADDGS
ncbi:MAG: hypothetical protein ACRD1X_16355 [Vicinamibacteria bacterium]